MEDLYFVSSFNKYKNEKLQNEITSKHIYCKKQNKGFLDLCLKQQIRRIESSNYKIILQLATAELVYRGILIPKGYEDREEEYLESLSLFVPETNRFFKSTAITEDFLISINKPSIVFCGVGSDIGVARPGTRFGPELLRSRSGGIAHRSDKLSIMDLHKNIAIKDDNKVYDIGSINLNPKSSKEVVLERVKKAADRIPKICIPIFVGGDHLMSYPLIKSLHKKHPNLALVQLDHHLDIQLWGDFENGSPKKLTSPIHSNFISWLKNDIPDLEITQIGINAYQGANEDNIDDCMEYLDKITKNSISNVEVLLSDDITSKLPKSKEIYLTIDVDALCSSLMPVTGYPAPIGLNLEQFLGIINFITKHNKIVAVDFMEFGVSSKFDIHLSSADIVCSAILMILGNIL